jgi:hypothetical protein
LYHTFPVKTTKKPPRRRLFSDALMAHQQFGNHVEHAIVASAATGGAMGDLLHVFKGGQYVLKGFMTMQSIGDIVKADLFAVAYHIIFTHRKVPPLFFCPYFTMARRRILLEIQQKAANKAAFFRNE